MVKIVQGGFMSFLLAPFHFPIPSTTSDGRGSKKCSWVELNPTPRTLFLGVAISICNSWGPPKQTNTSFGGKF